MALGGGTFSVQNKVLPGSYMNFVSKNSVDANLSERGVVAIGTRLFWGPVGMIELTKEYFQKNSEKLFGCDCTGSDVWQIREAFKHCRKILLYNMNNEADKASNIYATSKYSGVRGNSIAIEVLKNADESFDVSTIFNKKYVDRQTVKNAASLKNNDYVKFKSGITLTETEVGGVLMTGGKNSYGNSGYIDFLNTIEKYSFNVLVCNIGYDPDDDDDADSTILRNTFAEFTKRMRDEEGMKFQTVMYDYDGGDYEGIISVKNYYEELGNNALVYWVAGLTAGLTAGESAANTKYDGELSLSWIKSDYSQEELRELIQKGHFVLHRVDDNEIRVLADINTLVTTTDTKGSVFKENQTVRICDQIATDISAIFNRKYFGKVPNDKAGRFSLWNEIVRLHEQLQTIRAIEDFNEEEIIVEIGDEKTAVVVNEAINVINGMGKLYMTITVA